MKRQAAQEMRTEKKNKSKDDLARERRKKKAEKRKKKGQDLASIRGRETAARSRETAATWRPDELGGTVVRVEKSSSDAKSRKKGIAARLKEVNKRNLIVVILILLFLALIARNVIRLQIEQMQLQKQNEELKEQEKELRVELENINSKEYIEKEARRQLRLVNPDEILFVFPDEEESEEENSGNSENTENADGGNSNG